MTNSHDIDRVLSPWLYENDAPPPPPPAAGGRDGRDAGEAPYETRLQSAGAGDSGTITLTPATMYASSQRLSALRTEVETDVNTALNEVDPSAIGPNLQTAQAVAHVEDRWREKLNHLLEDMQERVDRVRKAADNWGETEKEIAKAYEGTS